MSSYAKVFAGLFLILLLTGCDGGIFGTGDDNSLDDAAIGGSPVSGGGEPGDNTVQEDGREDDPTSSDGGEGDTAPNDMSAPSAESDNDASGDSGEAAGDPDGADGTDQLPDDIATDEPEFTNTRQGYRGDTPLIGGVNATGESVELLAFGDAAEPRRMELEPGESAGYFAWQVGASRLEIRPLDDADALTSSDTDGSSTTLDMLLGSGSVTTVLIEADETPSGLSLRALRTRGETDDASVAEVRVIQDMAAVEGSSLALQLVPTGEQPGSTTVELPTDSDQSDGYVVVGPGNYRLEARVGQFMPEPLDLSGGQVVTLFVRATAAGLEIQRRNDSDLDVR